MKNLIFSALVVLVLVMGITLTDSQKIRSNARRSAGLIPQPRTGRSNGYGNNNDLRNVATMERAIGLVNYPRIGRSGRLSTLQDDNVRRTLAAESQADLDIESDSTRDPEIGDNEDTEETIKNLGILPNEGGMWLQPRFGRRLWKSHQSGRVIDVPWALFLNTGDFTRSNPSSTDNSVALKLNRETDNDIENFT